MDQDGSGQGAWRSMVTYMGGLTFDADEPEKYLKVTNRIAAKRFRMALLGRLHLYGTMNDAVAYFSSNGNLRRVLGGYLRIMRQHKKFVMSEENHRDSIYMSILDNAALANNIKYQIKPSGKLGYADLVIESD